MIESSTSRLVLRQWREPDRAPFAAMNADPQVMEHFPNSLTRDQSDALMDRFVEQIRCDGYGLWAVEVKESGEFIGFVGLAVPTWQAAFTPCTEIGWRLARSAWGAAYASEAAIAALTTAFGSLGLNEVVSFTSTSNSRSQRVMKNIGMTRNLSEDFDHPRIDSGPLRRHVLYRVSRAGWEARSIPPPTATAP